MLFKGKHFNLEQMDANAIGIFFGKKSMWQNIWVQIKTKKKYTLLQDAEL